MSDSIFDKIDRKTEEIRRKESEERRTKEAIRDFVHSIDFSEKYEKCATDICDRLCNDAMEKLTKGETTGMCIFPRSFVFDVDEQLQEVMKATFLLREDVEFMGIRDKFVDAGFYCLVNGAGNNYDIRLHIPLFELYKNGMNQACKLTEYGEPVYARLQQKVKANAIQCKLAAAVYQYQRLIKTVEPGEWVTIDPQSQVLHGLCIFYKAEDRLIQYARQKGLMT